MNAVKRKANQHPGMAVGAFVGIALVVFAAFNGEINKPKDFGMFVVGGVLFGVFAESLFVLLRWSYRQISDNGTEDSKR